MSRKVSLETGLGRGLRFPGNPGDGNETERALQAGSWAYIAPDLCVGGVHGSVHGFVWLAGRGFVTGAASSVGP